MAKGPIPGGVRRGSLAAKLACLLPGQSLMLDDADHGKTATPLERAVQTLMSRSLALQGCTFTTSRLRYIDGDRLKPALRITRSG